MNPNPLLKGINIVKIISSLNKTLNVVNKAIPMYEELKPIIGNLGNIKKILSNLNNTETNTNANDSIKESKVVKIKKESNNLPTFFQ